MLEYHGKILVGDEFIRDYYVHIPVFIVAALNSIKQYIVICKNGTEIELSAGLLNAINEKPDDFVVFIENWDKQKEEYINILETIFADHIINGEKEINNFAYVARAMQRWLASLPKYAKEMTSIYKGSKLDREKIKFVNALKKPEINAREFLFDDIINIYNLREFTPGVADNIEKTKAVFDNAIEKLMDELAEDIRECFGAGQSKKATLISIMLDWYDALKDTTKSHLFNNGEDKILGLIENATNDEKAFVSRIAKGIAGLRIEDWNEKSIETFVAGLASFKDAVEIQDSKIEEGVNNSYSLTFQDKAGNSITNLMVQAKSGNDYARNRLIEMLMKIAIKMALNFTEKYHTDLGDTIQYAFEGLIIAYEKFEIGRQDNFTTYAPWWIRQNLHRTIDVCYGLHTPAHYDERLMAILDIYNEHYYYSCNKYDICPEFIRIVCDKLEISEKQAKQCLSYMQEPICIDELVKTEDTSLLSWTNDEITNEVAYCLMKDQMQDVLYTLTPRESNVIKMRFGLDDGYEKSLEEVGKVFGVTRERIRQIEAKALRKLRHPSRSKKLKNYLD